MYVHFYRPRFSTAVFFALVVYRLPATGRRSPGIACRQSLMIGWHVPCDWKRCGTLLSRWRRPLRSE